MKYPLVTCYILTYNNFEEIYSAIDSILCQKYPNIEIAVFDDGSQNFPEIKIEEYIQINKRKNIKNVIIHRNSKNLGIVKNNNLMVKNTHGQYLMGLGQDDKFHDEHVCENVVKFFLSNSYYLVSSYIQAINEKGTKLHRSPRRINATRIKRASAKQQFKLISKGISIAGAGTFFDRKIFDIVDEFDDEYILQDDGPFFLKVTRAGYKIGFFEGITLDYKLGKGVSSGKILHPQLQKDIYRLYRKEIDPYIDEFNFFEKRVIKYQKERIKMGKILSLSLKIKMCIKYPDVVFYRFIFSH